MISVDDALARLLALIQPTPIEYVSLREAAGRVLALPVQARRTQPPFPASAMDGYAVRSNDIKSGATLTVIGEAQAGRRFEGGVTTGQAVRIFTGAPVPPGADRILIQEDTHRTDNIITVREDIDTKHYIRPAGTDFKVGTEVAPQKLTHALVALLASMNIDSVPVRRRPIVALIATGDELVTPGETPGPDQIVSSNAYGLAAMLEAEGAEARILPIARDTVQSLTDVFALAENADFIVTLGGASVGDHDLVAKVAQQRGMTLDFYKVRMRPGKPLMAGTMGHSIMVGLPGNPVSAMVCGHIFLRPALQKALGLNAEPLPRERVPLAHDLAQNAGREHYMRAHVTDGVVSVFERQDSALLSVLAQSNALVVRAPYDPMQPSGTLVDVIRT